MNRQLQKGTQVNHTTRSARTPFLRTGIFAAMRGVFGGSKESGARSSGGVGGRTSSLRLAALIVLAATALLALTASPASAFLTRPYLSQVTGLSTPAGVSIDPSGNAWVTDPGSAGLVSEYSPFPANAKIGEQDGKGQFGCGGGFVESSALNGSNGRLYVTDSCAVVVDSFENGTGAFVEQWSGFGGSFGHLAIDNSPTASTGRVYVSQTQGAVVNALDANDLPVNFSAAAGYIEANKLTGTPTGAGGAVIPFGKPWTMAVGPDGDLYVVDDELQVVDRFAPSGEFVRQIAKTPVGPFGSLTAVAVDPTSGNLLVADAGNNVIDEFGPTGAFLGETNGAGSAGELTSPQGIAVDSTGHLYVTDGSALKVFGPAAFAPLSIDSTSASGVSATAATLETEINPHGVPTTFHFEYDTTPYLEGGGPHGESTATASAGSGFSASAGSAHIQALAPATTYHYRVLATNELGTLAGPDRTFTTQAAGGAPSLLDSRAWELVSPPQKRGARIEGIRNEGDAVEASAKGDAITYLANAPTEAGPQGNVILSQLLSARSPQGWRTADINPPYTASEGTGPSVGEGQQYRAFSEDLSTAVDQPFGAFEPKLSPQASEQTPFLRTNFPVGEPTAFCASACFRPLVSAAPSFENVPAGTHFGEEGICPSKKLRCGPQFQGASPDAGHVVVFSEVGLTAGEGSTGGLYEWDRATGGLAFLGTVNSFGDGLGRETGESAPNAISADGSRVFFHGESEGLKGLLMRDVPAGKTLKLDQAEAGCGGCESGGGVFQTASRDGSTVFFTSDRRLTEGSGAQAGKPDLYACQIAEEPNGEPACHLSDLTPVGPGGEPADVLGAVLGAAADGSDVFFAADGAQGASPGAVAGECSNPKNPQTPCNLYLVRREGSAWSGPRLIAVLSAADGLDWQTTIATQPTRVSPNGGWLAFTSTRPIAGFDNRDAQSGEALPEAYLYDAATGQLECASCAPSGARPIGRAVEHKAGLSPVSGLGGPLAGGLPGWTTYILKSAVYQPRYLSDSGRLFFAAADRLVPADVNSALDVYEFEPQGTGGCDPAAANPAVVFKAQRAFSFEGRAGSEPPGCVGLISSGTSNVESEFLDASASGDDVFFRTSAALSSTDIDTAPDVYDARVDGGFPEPAQPPVCQGDACQSPAVPPNDSTPNSLTFNGAGNVVECPKGKVKKSGKCVAKKSKKNKHSGKHHSKKGKKSKKGRATGHNRGGQK